MQVANYSCNLEGLTENMIPPGYDIVPYPSLSDQRQEGVQVAVWNNNHRFREVFFNLLPDLELLINWGTNDFNLPNQSLFRERSIELKKVDAYSTRAVAEYIISMLLSYERKLKNVFQGERPNAKEITGKKTGIIGLGKIGFCAADILRSGFQNQIMYAATSDKKIDGMEYAPIPRILAENDFVIVAAKSRTFSLQETDFQNANPDLVIVNVSGSEIVPEAVIVPIIGSKRIRGYVSDYMGKHPSLSEAGGINTPHLAYKTDETQWNKTSMLSFFLRKHHSRHAGYNPIFILRHGQALWNELGLFQGRSDSPLTEAGIAQAHSMAEFFQTRKIETIFTSPLGRAMQTSAIISKKNGAKIEIIPELMEIDFGLFQGKPRKELELLFREFFAIRERSKLYTKFPGGESYFDVHQRLLPQITHLAATRERFAIMGHESVNRVIRAILRETNMVDAVHDCQENNQIIEFNMADDSETVHEV